MSAFGAKEGIRPDQACSVRFGERYSLDSEFARGGRGPALTRDDAESFAKGNKLVGRDIFELLVEAIGPMDVNIDRAVRAQAKMQSRVIA